MSLVTNTALPLAHPLVSQVGGWGTIDQWACRGLDRVEEAAPIITQPTKEVRNFLNLVNWISIHVS
ncbi:Perilipin-2 [Portunus trituberculatus]|uniref:Perilipin-2 n=1 Tax=Portunus trituberculatus TaxID=210409 RepID=A0A5B7JJB7_PORTR|nr:Perilipin-2 [Portunus trituberculatus]